MYIIRQTFKKNIMLNNNIIENCINLDNYIENYINTEFLNKNINGYITIKLKKYKYLYPKLITNKLYINNKYIIKTYMEFDTIKFYKNQIITGLKLSEETTNKFGEITFLTKTFNENIKITAVDINVNSIEKYKKDNNIVKILNINYIDNKVNLIVENVNENYFGTIIYFRNNYIDKNNTDISPLLDISKNFKFNIAFSTNNKKKENLTINEIVDRLNKLPKKNTFIIKFNQHLIEITETEENITYKEIDIYIINTLIEFNNYYLITQEGLKK
jgi:hypothetical protein